MIKMNATNLSVNNAEYTRFDVLSNINGGAYIKEIGGDFFKLQAAEPLVTVYVNDFLASCTSDCVLQGQECNKMCKYSYSDAVTPSLTSISSSEVDKQTVLTISGDRFSTKIDDYIINVGDDVCEAIEATTTEIKCNLKPGPAGIFDFTMVIKSRGEATQPSSGQLTFKVDLTGKKKHPTE